MISTPTPYDSQPAEIILGVYFADYPPPWQHQVKVGNIATNKLSTLYQATGMVTSMAVSPDGNGIVSGGGRGKGDTLQGDTRYNEFHYWAPEAY